MNTAVPWTYEPTTAPPATKTASSVQTTVGVATTEAPSTSAYVATTVQNVPLRVEIVSPKTGDYASSVKEIKAMVRSADGKALQDDSLAASAAGTSFTMQRSGDYFAGALVLPENTSLLELSLIDSQGRSGSARVVLIPSTGGGFDMGAVFSWLLPLAVLFFILLLVLLIASRITSGKKENEDQRRAVDRHTEAKKSLEPVMTRREPVQKKREPAQKKQEPVSPSNDDAGLSDWVREKLKGGEDPEVLKKGLEEMGFDPSIVDRLISNRSDGAE